MEVDSVSQQPDGRELRGHLHGMWASVAGGWAENADYVDERSTETTAELLARSRPQPGERILELACGPGGVGLAAAELVAPGGEVVLSDVVPEMTATAAQRADALGLGNVRIRVLDLESIDEPDASYDVVLCREGMMFAADPARAAGEIQRVLRPHGRFAIAVWGPRARNPWLGAVLDAASAQLGMPMPPPGMPGPFALEDADGLAGLFEAAGLMDVEVRELPVPLRARSFEEWWSRTSALAGPLAKILASMPDEAREAIREHAREAIKPYETGAGLEIPGVTLIAAGRRAG